MTISGDFTVDPDAITKLAALAGRAGSAASLYAAAAKGPNELGDGLLGLLTTPLVRWQALGVANGSKAHSLASAYDTTLVAVAKLYRGTDLEAAEKADKTYPDAHSERISADGVTAPETAATFTDFEDASRDPRHPEKEYTAPDNPSEDAFGGWNIECQRIADKIFGSASIAGSVRGILTKLLGFDLMEVIEKAVAGDWDGLLAQGMVFEDSGRAFGWIKQNIDRGRYGIQESWTGHAGEAARAWLTDYSYACAAHAKFCTEAGWKIKNFARAAYDAMLALDIALEALLDKALDPLLKIGNTLKGALLGIAGLGHGDSLRTAIAGIISDLTPIGAAIDTLTALVHTVAAVSETVAGNGDIAAQAWPGEPYKHPGL